MHCVHEEDDKTSISSFTAEDFLLAEPDLLKGIPKMCRAKPTAPYHGMLVASSEMPGQEQPAYGFTVIKSHSCDGDPVCAKEPGSNAKIETFNFKQVLPAAPAVDCGSKDNNNGAVGYNCGYFNAEEQWFSVKNLAPVSGVGWGDKPTHTLLSNANFGTGGYLFGINLNGRGSVNIGINEGYSAVQHPDAGYAVALWVKGKGARELRVDLTFSIVGG